MTLPFNFKTYKALLANALVKGYRFIGFDSLSENKRIPLSSQHLCGNNDGSILLRHDVDGDLVAALNMARLEAELGISSTYFLMWRSPCYNLMSRFGQSAAEQILAYGHQIGLHYDQGFDSDRNLSADYTVSSIEQQATWLEQFLDTTVHSISFHQPSSSLLQSGVDCGPRINTYDRFILSDFTYISDSNRIFPPWNTLTVNSDEHELALSNLWPSSIQLLIHPMWWYYDKPTTNLVWDSVLQSNFRTTENQLLATERAFGNHRQFHLFEQPNEI